MNDTSWLDQAACASSGREFVIDGAEARTPGLAEALAWEFCDRCPVRQQCLTFGLANELMGVWGGVLLIQRGPRRDLLARAS